MPHSSFCDIACEISVGVDSHLHFIIMDSLVLGGDDSSSFFFCFQHMHRAVLSDVNAQHIHETCTQSHSGTT